LHHLFLVNFFLFFLGITTGFVGTNTGGSAFLTVPIMIFLGIQPQSAIATARFASMGTMLAGLRQFHRYGKIDYKLAVPAAGFGLVGSLAGAIILIYINAAIVHRIIGLATLLMVILALIKKPKVTIHAPSQPKLYFSYFLFILTGMIGGLFGGQAKLTTYIFILIYDKTVSESVGTRKVSGLISSFGALLVYGIHRIVNWGFGLTLICGTVIGSTLGAKYALNQGDRWMERLLNVVVILLALRLIFLPI
jgi:uncharacterized membrane protein YfcA